MSNAFDPPLVISIHGIRTHAAWQKTLATVLSGSTTKSESFDFGYYSTLKFLSPQANDRKIEEFHQWYSMIIAKHCQTVRGDSYDCRPSIVAHSFGSWILGYAMQKFNHIKFDKIILCGSVLPQDFDWARLFARNQVGMVRNECGGKDPWPKWAGLFVVRAGTAGSKGFRWAGPLVDNVNLDDFTHSEFSEMHMKTNWLPFLRTEPSSLSVIDGRFIDNRSKFDAIRAHTRNFIDTEAYGSLEHYQNDRLDDDISGTWIDINPDIYSFLIDSKLHLPAGYLNAMPVTAEAYNSIASGDLRDNQISAAHIVPYLPDNVIDIYLMSIAVSRSHRNPGHGLMQSAHLKLMFAMFNKLIYYALHHRIFVRKILATTWTPEGKRLCDSLGMKYNGVNKYNHEIRELNIEDIINSKVKFAPILMREILKVYRKNNAFKM